MNNETTFPVSTVSTVSEKVIKMRVLNGLGWTPMNFRMNSTVSKVLKWSKRVASSPYCKKRSQSGLKTKIIFTRDVSYFIICNNNFTDFADINIILWFIIYQCIYTNKCWNVFSIILTIPLRIDKRKVVSFHSESYRRWSYRRWRR